MLEKDIAILKDEVKRLSKINADVIERLTNLEAKHYEKKREQNDNRKETNVTNVTKA